MNPVKVFVGVTLIFIGLTLITISQLQSSYSVSNLQYGGVVMIGPIPIVFGSSPGMASFALVFALLVFAFVFLTLFRI